MELHNKNLKEYWDTFKIPFFFLTAWSILGLILAVFYFDTYKSVYANWSGTVLAILAFWFIGWEAVKDFKFDIHQAAIAGALCGVLIGFIGAIIGLLTFLLAPNVLADAVAQATAQGVSADMVQRFAMLGAYLGIVFAPIVNAIFGAAISAIAGFFSGKFTGAKKTKKK